MTYFTTITSKGQITLPVEFRRALKMAEGHKLSVKFVGDSIVVKPIADKDAIRERTEQHLRSAGYTPERLQQMAQDYQSGDGFTAQIKEKYGKS